MINSNKLSVGEEKKLVKVLKENMEAIEWTIVDIKWYRRIGPFFVANIFLHGVMEIRILEPIRFSKSMAIV